MSKKIMVGFAVVLFSIFALANSAFAFGSFDEIYMVGSEGSIDQKDTFGWNEQPWLYLHLPEPGFNITISWWKSPGYWQYANYGRSCEQETWLTLKRWNHIKQLGQWDVNARYFLWNLKDPVGCGSTDFTVTPEPVSSVLFLVGGISLAAVRLRRRKK